MAGERPLGEIADIRQGRYLAPEKMAERSSEATPIPVWGARGVIGFTDSPSYSHAVPIVTCRGNGCGLVQWTRGSAYISNNAMAVVPTTSEPADTRYLYYSLLTADLGEVTTGSAQPQITIGYLSRKEVFWTDDGHERAAIAHILGTLDDKIELNRRMSETLEAMARALFKAWFVDFEPVRAKMEGRWQRGQSLPGLPAHLYDLFPDRLVPSELGEIPEGWEVGSFGSFISQRSERVGARDVVVLSAVANGKLVRSDDHFKKRVYSKDTGKYLLVEQWDFAYNPSRINIGSIGMLEEDLVGGVSPVYVVVRPAPAYRWFLQFSIRRLHTKKWIETLASGSVRQSLSYSDFASIPCVVPPEEVVQEFDRRWSTWREGVCLRETETRTLAQLRDTLLPKLISGELRVKDAETFLERVAT